LYGLLNQNINGGRDGVSARPPGTESVNSRHASQATSLAALASLPEQSSRSLQLQEEPTRSTVTIPGPITNDLRQGLTLRMGDAAQALEQASLVDRRKRAYEMFAEHFEQIDAVRDLFDALGWEHIELDLPEIEGVEIDLDEHWEALKAGLDEATMMLRAFAEEGSPDQRQQAVSDLAEVECFAVLLATIH
jgi:hypothetical protein